MSLKTVEQDILEINQTKVDFEGVDCGLNYPIKIEKKHRIKKFDKYTYLFLKRIFDILFSSIGLIFVFFISIFIKISYIITGDFNSIIFKQIRTGKDGKNFTLYKFRSMVVKNDVRDTSKEDQYTKVGKIIRKLSLDELLQLVNVLKGDMSFVGPRPWIPEYYQNFTDRQKHRCDMKPGISGYAQVKGRNTISIFDKINYDLVYIEKASVLMDIKVMILTVLTIFCQKGVDAGKRTIHEELKELKSQEKFEISV